MPRFPRIFITAFFILSAAGTAWAQSFTSKEMSPAADECLAEAKTGGAVAFCLGVEQVKQDDRVDSAYSKSIANKEDSERIILRNAQKTWQQKQVAYCNKTSPKKLSKIECLALTAKARADHLESQP